jgi:hypothetical protein
MSPVPPTRLLITCSRLPSRPHRRSTIGIVGYGRIGRRVAALAEAFGMRVLAHDPFAAPPDTVNCPDLDELAARSDVITLHVPLTDATRHLVDRRFLASVKPGAVLVNCGRGGGWWTWTRYWTRSSGAGSPVSAWTSTTPSRPPTTRSSTTLTCCSPRT